MTAKGIAQLRKKYGHVNSMEPQQLREFEGHLIAYINIQRSATIRTGKEGALHEITPVLQEAVEMHNTVRQKLINLR